MSYIIWNGSFYISTSETGRVIKIKNRDEAKVYLTLEDAKNQMRKAPSKTKNYCIRDEDTNERIDFSVDEMGCGVGKKKIKRKKYSDDVKKLLYMNADGKCEICGKKILLKDISLDHRVPLSKGGEDDVTNLACTCDTCNKMKGCILPEDLLDKMSEILTYQIERRHKHSILWKFAKCILGKMIASEQQS